MNKLGSLTLSNIVVQGAVSQSTPDAAEFKKTEICTVHKQPDPYTLTLFTIVVFLKKAEEK